MQLHHENAIVTANNFNVMLVSQVWLINNGIVNVDEFNPPACVFTPPLVHVTTDDFGLLLMEGRLQFTPTCNEEAKQPLLIDRLGRFITTLPHTPYSGLGLNFVWHWQPNEAHTIQSVGRRLFFHPDTPLANEFNTDDATFGSYFSKNFAGFRLKLSIAPVDVVRHDAQAEASGEEVMQFAFNYHLSSSNANELSNALAQWDAVKAHSRQIVEAIEGWL